MRNERFDAAVTAILKRDPRYPREAYQLISEVLQATLCRLRQESREQGRPEEVDEHRGNQHVTGRQLAEGLRDYMLDRFGPFAGPMLSDLRICRTEDIGVLVYNLIRVGAFGRSERDSLDDFAHVYDFEEAFREPFEPRNA